MGGSSPPEASVYSVKSVGDYSPPETSVNSVNSVGGLAQTNLEWVLWKEFGGWRGYGRMPYPPNLWASVKSVGEYSLPEASVNSVGGMAEGGVGMAGCHTLLSGD